VRHPDGVLLRAGDPGGREQEPVLHHRLWLAPPYQRRDALRVEPDLVVERGGDEARRASDLRATVRRRAVRRRGGRWGHGVPEQEEVVRVQRDPVPPAEIAGGPELVEPA